MIASLQGTLTHKSLSGIIVEVNGIGYQVFVPLSTYYELPEVGFSVSLKIHTYVKKTLFSFSGFGPRKKGCFSAYDIGDGYRIKTRDQHPFGHICPGIRPR